MPSLRAAVTALMLAGLVASPATAAQRPDRTGPARPGSATGAVHGRVTGPNGVPLRGAEVRVRDPNGRENRLATTDEEGRYQVDNLLPGTWSVSAAKGGYITQQFGQRGPFSAASRLRLPHASARRPTSCCGPAAPSPVGCSTSTATLSRARASRWCSSATTAAAVSSLRPALAIRPTTPAPSGCMRCRPATTTWRPAFAPRAPAGSSRPRLACPLYYPGTRRSGTAQRLSVAVLARSWLGSASPLAAGARGHACRVPWSWRRARRRGTRR